jgi:hypothetical protein
MITMNALLTMVALWLSTNFALPVGDAQPRIERLPPAQIAALHRGVPLTGPHTADPGNQVASEDIVSVYVDETRIIYLRDDWTGRTPAELSVLVHEMVHHFQNVAGLKYACAGEREKLAYEAQERWLSLFGRDLASEFQIDPFSRLVKTQCLF